MESSNLKISFETDIEPKLRAFIDRIFLSPTPPIGTHRKIDTIWGSSEKGFITLDREEEKEYEAIIISTLLLFENSDTISRRYIESSIQKVILEALDINEQNSNLEFSDRMDTAINNFKNIFALNLIEYEFHYPVLGMDVRGLPQKFGPIEFFEILPDYLEKFHFIEKDGAQNAPSATIEWIKQEMTGRLGSVYAQVTILAADDDAAKDIAMNTLQDHLDYLNFFIRIVPYSKDCFFYLPGDADRALPLQFIRATETEAASGPGKYVVGPRAYISFQQIIDAEKENDHGFSKIKEWLFGNPNEYQKLIINSIRWAGKAWVCECQNKFEQAFLFYMISLESLILIEGSKNRRNLGYRLSNRVASLLGKNYQGKQYLYDQMKKAYQTRSNIVHDGKYKITFFELGFIHQIAFKSIILLLAHKPFCSMKSDDDLIAWFNQAALGNNPPS